MDSISLEEQSQASESTVKGKVSNRSSFEESLTFHPVSATKAPLKRLSISQRWANMIHLLHKAALDYFIWPVARTAATNPRITTTGLSLFSVALLALGLYTNFNIEVNHQALWTPRNAETVKDGRWLSRNARFRPGNYALNMLIHNHGQDIAVNETSVDLLWQVLQRIEQLEDYDAICASNETACSYWGAPRMWNSYDDFVSDPNVWETLSANRLPEGVPVQDDSLYGYAVRDDSGDLVTVKSFELHFLYRRGIEGGRDWGYDLVALLSILNEEWKQNGVEMQLDGSHAISFEDEFMRSITSDLWLLPIVFIMMSAFTALMFGKARSSVQSRCGLGFCAVWAVTLSLASSFGINFYMGVPFTTITMLLPFILFGIGLDDAFIIVGAYLRTDPSQDILNRIHTTIYEAGASITLTSVTSTMAFALGCVSEIPAVFWLCNYAFLSVVFVYFYQLTFFVACVVLDEQRICQSRRDLLCCCIARGTKQRRASEAEESQGNEEEEDNLERIAIDPSIMDRVMEAYGRFLLNKWVRLVTIIIFAVFSCLCAYSTTSLRQDFDVIELLPNDSYLASYYKAQRAYASTQQLSIGVFFRNVDQSDPDIQQQMNDYVDQLVDGLDAVGSPPEFFWLNHLGEFTATMGISDEPFEAQLDAFLGVDVIDEFYGGSIIRDESGGIVYSKVTLKLDQLDVSNVRQQIRTLNQQRKISKRHPINQGRGENAFFTYSTEYKTWEFYKAVVQELIFSAVVGVLSVTVIALVFLPHLSAAPIICPLMMILYTDMLGVLQWAGISINAVSYIILAMSIGLLVDFLMHILLRYYELPGTRQERVVETLRTMGSSVLLGGITTFLGTVPLSFSVSHIFYTVFVSFVAIVGLGITHGLILLPVILASIGTQDQSLADIEAEENRRSGVESSNQPSPPRKSTADTFITDSLILDSFISETLEL